MRDFIIIVICLFAILCSFIAVVYYTGTFWVKLFKLVYGFFERYWRLAWLLVLLVLCIYKFTELLSLLNK